MWLEDMAAWRGQAEISRKPHRRRTARQFLQELRVALKGQRRSRSLSRDDHSRAKGGSETRYA